MSIPGTTRIGPYKILELAGKGGMGEVYRALDTRLDRIVAIKLILQELSDSSISRARFLAEARAASALNHPNICAVYDIGEWEGRPFLAMEYLEGQNLQSYLRRGPLRAEALSKLGIQIADALTAAHERGILHRDIKPGNIFITSDGNVKVLDFGLAKRSLQKAQMHAGSPDFSTVTAHEDFYTSPGSVAGTAAYMSPEQARGEDLDPRSDLFSFGLVLYEMATARLAFEGRTLAELFASLLTSQPEPPSALNPSLPGSFDAIVDKALEKDRELRYQHASEICTDLKRFQRSLSTAETATPAVKTKHKVIWLIGAGVILAALLTAVIFRRSEQMAPLNLKPIQITRNSGGRPASSPCISPDGKYLAYQDSRDISVRLIATGETRTLKRPDELSGDDEWRPVDWFPDGTRLLANSGNLKQGNTHTAIWSVSAFTGSATRLRADAVASAISRQSSLIAATSGGERLDQEIWVMGPQGEDARRIAVLPATGKVGFFNLTWLPNERRLGYFKGPRGSYLNRTIETVDLNGGPPRILVPDARTWTAFRWLRDGRLLYVALEPGTTDERNFWEVRTDSLSGAPVGKPRRLSDLPSFSISHLSVSADGKKAMFSKGSTRWSVFVSHLQTNGSLDTPVEMTFRDDQNLLMDWAADSKSVIFAHSRRESGEIAIYKQPVNSDTPDAITVLKTNLNNETPIIVRTMPGGTSLLAVYRPSDALKNEALSRVSILGGAPEIIARGHFSEAACASAPATECAVEKFAQPDDQGIMFAYNVVKNTFRELFALSRFDSWNLAPDGSRFLTWQPGLRNGLVQIRSLNGTVQKELRLAGWNELIDVEWNSDGKSLLVSAKTPRGFSLLRTDLDGHVQTLWNSSAVSIMYPIPSPDGKQLALNVQMEDVNVWMLEGF
jgi:serine/threonine protein kinase